MNHKRTKRTATVLFAALLLLAGLQGPALAGPSLLAQGLGTAQDIRTARDIHAVRASGATHTVDLVSTADGFTAPTTTRPGLTTFRASTTQVGKGWIGLARLTDGADWGDFLGALGRALSDTPSDVPQGAKELDATAALLGGLVIQPGRPGSFTQRLAPGEYLLFDYLTAGDAQPRYRRLTVSGAPVDQGLVPAATIVSRNVPGVGPRFEVRGTLRAGRPLRFVNKIPGQVNELLFVKIAEGTTEADLKTYFDAVADDGTLPPNSPFLSAGLGSLHLSTDRSSVVQVPLESTRYAALTWSKDATDGIRLVKKGLFTIVDVG